MPRPLELKNIANHLLEARRRRRLSQAELAMRAGLSRPQIAFFERGTRTPDLVHVLKLAKALDLPLQSFLGGNPWPGGTVAALALELRTLGLIDLWVDKALVPGAFRAPEEVVALAIAGEEPEPRILEGIPALLAWNRWRDRLLWAYARNSGRTTLRRLAWLADVVLALERTGGFPGGCVGKEDLARFLARVKDRPPDRWDPVGPSPSGFRPPPLWKRWRISYAANANTFRQRAEKLVELAAAEERKPRLSTE